ncbi:MAG: murein L,D-transpeptidase [Anaerolineae bacterium]|nr:MAG: murein L,D-transpeptidase [Anaerolineae bacterium]
MERTGTTISVARAATVASTCPLRPRSGCIAGRNRLCHRESDMPMNTTEPTLRLSSNPLSRREFLKLSAAGFLGLFLAGLRRETAQAAAAPPGMQGRVAYNRIYVYDTPSFHGEQVGTYTRDQVFPIAAQVTGEDETAYNRLWYYVAGEGYVYSGGVQPVRTVKNKPSANLPQEGALAEVTVPYTEAHEGPGSWYHRRYRLYYGTTHWVIEAVEAEEGVWYRVYDNNIHDVYFAPAEDLRIVPPEELAPLSPDVPPDLKYIHVDVRTQTVFAFEDERPVLISPCATGAKGSRTPLGLFRTFHKGPTIHMIGRDGKKITYDLPGVPWVSFFTGTGISFHGTYWHNDYGRPQSNGCVNLPMYAAKFLYRWTTPIVPVSEYYYYRPGEGTTVQVVKSLPGA